MTEKIKTPRTDAVANAVRMENSKSEAGFVNMTAALDLHSRQLERELALITQERDALREALEEQLRQMNYPELPQAFADTMKRMIKRALKMEVLP